MMQRVAEASRPAQRIVVSTRAEAEASAGAECAWSRRNTAPQLSAAHGQRARASSMRYDHETAPERRGAVR